MGQQELHYIVSLERQALAGAKLDVTKIRTLIQAAGMIDQKRSLKRTEWINRSLTRWPLGGATTPCRLISFVFSSSPVL
jgi:hypothetical protein